MSGYGCETGAAILPPIDCTGSKLVQFNRSSNESFSTTIMVKAGGEGNFLVNGVALPSGVFTDVLGTAGVWKSARLTYINNAAVVLGTTIGNGTNRIENSTNLFHLGITNGGESSGCRYGYFSSFNSLNLGPDINIFYGSNIVLDATTFGANGYVWSPGGQTTSQITVNARTTENYSVQVNIGGCLLNAAICVGTIEYIWTGFQDTNYNNINNWSRPCGVNVVPDCTRDVIIPDSVNGAKTPRYPNLNNVTVSCRNLIIEKGAELNFAGSGQINVCGDMIHSGFLNMPQPANTLVFIGTQPQLYTRTATGTGEFATLRISNQTPNDPRIKVSAGGTENMIVSSFGTLDFDRGFIITEGTKEVVVKNKAVNSIIGYSPAAIGNGKFVAGRLRRYINTLGSYDLPVGLATETVSAPVAQAGKRATMIGTVSNALNWPTNTLNCNPNPFVNNHAIALNTNNAQGNASSTLVTNGQHIQIPISAGISGNNLRTIEGWFKTDNAINSGGALFYMGTPALKELFALRKGAGTNEYRIDVGGGFGLDFTVAGINNGNWHHFAMTYDGSKVEVYTDGLFRISLAIDLNTNLGNFYIGRYVDDIGRNWYLKGQYDNIRVWNVARTADEIQLNICTYYECVTPSGLIADYDMEDGFGFVDFKTRTCAVSLLQYERANVNFQTPMTTSNNLLAFFNQYPVLPLSSPLSYVCQANFGSCEVLNHGFWTISAFDNATQVTGGNSFYRLTLFNNAYTNAGSCVSPQAAIMKRATSANPWVIPTFPTLCFNNSLNQTSMEFMTGFSDFGVPMTLDPVILPVDLIALTAKTLTNSILVEWKTANEIDNAGFEVWRSMDSENFVKVGWVAQNNLNSYQFEDREVNANQMYYYYLKQIDNTGNSRTSKVVNAKIDASMEGGINVYPNPTNSEFMIDLGETYTTNTTYQIEIYTSIGMLVKSKTSTNSSKINMSLEGLAKGMYLIKVITPSRTKFVKLQKE